MLRGIAALIAAGCALAVVGCGETASTGNFKGEQRRVAETISNFQKDVTASDEGKVCQHDVAASVTARLKSAGGCEAIVKKQLKEIDSLNLSIEAISINGNAAQARVKSTWSGSNRVSTLALTKEGSRWKIAGAG